MRDETATGEVTLPGRVVGRFGVRALVEDAAGDRHLCLLAGRSLGPVCGDEVRWRAATEQAQDLLVEILPRRNELTRPSRRGQREVLAANLDRVVVVAAPEPPPDPFLVDRYLAAAELMGADGCLVYNKTDLDPRAGRLDLDEYARIGHPVLAVSADTGEGMAQLADALRGHTSILVGHSGTGKSSLLNRLLPGIEAATAGLSTATGEGRHTTTTSVLYHLPAGGEVIDSPGVRDYAPAPVPARDAQRGYREIRERASDCRFADCMHMREPGCAVKDGVETGRVSTRRYESYRRLVRLMESLDRGPGRA